MRTYSDTPAAHQRRWNVRWLRFPLAAVLPVSAIWSWGIRLVITRLVLDAIIVVTRALSVQLCAGLARPGGLAVPSVSAATTAYASLGIATRTADPIRRMSHDV